MEKGPFYSGAGPRRDKSLADAEATSLGSPPPAQAASPPPSAPASPSLMDRAKRALGIQEKPHNPANRAGVSHGPNDRGFP